MWLPGMPYLKQFDEFYQLAINMAYLNHQSIPNKKLHFRMPTKMEFNKMSFLVCIPPLALSKSGDGYDLSLII